MGGGADREYKVARYKIRYKHLSWSLRFITYMTNPPLAGSDSKGRAPSQEAIVMSQTQNKQGLEQSISKENGKQRMSLDMNRKENPWYLMINEV